MMKSIKLSIASLLLLPALSHANHQVFESAVFVNAELGEAQQDINAGNFPSGTVIDDRDGGYKLGLGFKAGLVGAGLSYINPGQSSVDTGSASAVAETDGLAFDATLNLPLSDSVDLYLKGGLFSWSQITDETVAGSSFGTHYEEEGVDPFWGIGARIEAFPGVNLKFEYNQFRFQDDGNSTVADYDFTTIGVEFLL